MLAPLSRLPRSVRYGAGALLVLLLTWGVALPLAFEPLLRWGLGQATASWGGHRLEFSTAQWSPWRLAADVQGLALRTPQGDELASVEALHVDLGARGLLRRAWTLESLRLDAPRAGLVLAAGGSTNWTALLQALATEPPPAGAPPPEPPRLLIDELRVGGGRLAWIDRRGGTERANAFEPIDLELRELSTLPEDRGTHQLEARSTLGGTLRWQGRFGLQPLQAEGRIEAEGLLLARLWALMPTPPLAIAPPAGTARLALGYRVDESAWQLDGLRVQLDGLALKGAAAAAPAVQLDQVVLEGGRVDGAGRTLAFDALRLQGGHVHAQRDAQGGIDLAAWAQGTVSAAPASPESPRSPQSPQSPDAPTAGTAAPAPAWTLKLDRLGVERLALAYEDRAFAEPLRIESAAATLQLGVDARLGGDAPAFALRDIALQLDALALRSGDAPPWLALNQLQLDGGALDGATQRVDAARLRLQGGTLALKRERDGTMALARALQPASGAAPSAALAAAGKTGVDNNADWRVRLATLQLEGWAATLTDAGTAPEARLGLDGLSAEARGLGNDLRRPIELRAAATVRSGGRLALQGRVTPQAAARQGAPAGPEADLRLRVDDLTLAAAQPYLDPLTVLRLAGGTARAEGRLQSRGAAWSYDGNAGLAGLRVDEPGRQQPFLALARLDAPRLRLSPAQLDLGNLRLDGLATEFIIDRERRVNLSRLGRPARDAAAAPAARPAPAAPPPRILLERLRLVDAQLDFADLSLALPFAARIQKLGGEVAGLDSAPGAPPATLELQGEVAPNGLARAQGSLQPLAPTAFSDVQVSFRNIEMTTLTPYTATFAGRRIDSGKLSLDLDYKLRERQLQGDNRVVMERLVLGERVESPGATSLPLDLAIALLQDSDGRIDLGLPVSGSLDDPKFAYGALVWKAIVNVLTKIATAPFRALGALFGGNDALADSIGRIGFDPGRAALLPPEREKLEKLAQALARRPGLAVLLPPPSAAVDADADRDMLRQLQLRRALAALEGRPLGPEGDPGPLALQLPRTQAALEQRFVQRFGAEALAQVRARLAAPAAAPKPGTTPATPPPAPPSPEALSALLWQQLLAAEVVDDAALQALGAARRAALADSLRAAGLDAMRIADAKGTPTTERPAAGGDKGSVVIGLDLGPAGAPR